MLHTQQNVGYFRVEFAFSYSCLKLIFYPLDDKKKRFSIKRKLKNRSPFHHRERVMIWLVLQPQDFAVTELTMNSSVYRYPRVIFEAIRPRAKDQNWVMQHSEQIYGPSYRTVMIYRCIYIYFYIVKTSRLPHIIAGTVVPHIPHISLGPRDHRR